MKTLQEEQAVLEAPENNMEMVVLDETYASEYVKNIHYEEVNGFKIYAVKLGYIVLKPSGVYVLTDRHGVYLLTH